MEKRVHVQNDEASDSHPTSSGAKAAQVGPKRVIWARPGLRLPSMAQLWPRYTGLDNHIHLESRASVEPRCGPNKTADVDQTLSAIWGETLTASSEICSFPGFKDVSQSRS